MKLTIGFSPCPNDTFIFDALVNKKIDTGDLEFEVIMEDVETLNRMALQEKLDITKISYGVLPRILPAYRVLDAGGALGEGVGPILVSSTPIDIQTVPDLSIALPGIHTTAHMLFNLAFPEAMKKVFMVFSDIEDVVLRGEVDLGVLIHENRFTYQQKGLLKIADMGELWEQNFQTPIPLGCIAVRRSLPKEQKKIIEASIYESVKYAFENPSASHEYIQQHSQEMSEEVQQQHIKLYVNDYSIALGEEGQKAIRKLFAEGQKAGLLPQLTEPVFI